MLTLFPDTGRIDGLPDQLEEDSSVSSQPDEGDEVLAAAPGTDPVASMADEESESGNSAVISDEGEDALAYGREGTFSLQYLFMLLAPQPPFCFHLEFMLRDANFAPSAC